VAKSRRKWIPFRSSLETLQPARCCGFCHFSGVAGNEDQPGQIGGVDVKRVLDRLSGEDAGSDDAPVHPIDVNGVLMSSIQGVHQLLEGQRAELDAIAARVEAITASRAAPLASSSGEESKRNQATVNSHEVLRKLAEIPITTWSYKWDDPSVRHIGPMAQDFAAAFGVGASDKVIDLADAAGVCLAAIKALVAVAEEQQQRIDDLKRLLESYPAST
jgi:hypothetical protein